MAFRVEPDVAAHFSPRHSATRSSGVARFDGAVNGEQSLAKRTLEDARKANTLKGLGLVRAFRGQHPSPSGGEDFTARRGNARVGARPKG
jgi:hypothetical protein